ncbi:MAG TPA: transporter substrate-binding domain-containing protein [Crinalium sp.]|jgi:polar amino acid transport system substrate-binding protein
MKRFKFLFTAVLSAVLTIFVITACNSGTGTNTAGQSPGASASGNGSPTQTLKMATSADYPPYEYIDTSSGNEEIIGFDVDIAKYVTDKLGYGLEINNVDFNGLIPALQAKRADFVMAGMTPTEERKQNVDFSSIYYEAKNTIMAKKGSNLTDAASLNGKKVGVQLGSIQEGAAKKIQGANVVPLNRINEIIQELKAGRIDAAIVEDTVSKGYIASNPDLEFHTIPNTGPSGSAIAFPKGSELVAKFDPVLQEMVSSGKIEELVNKWFGDKPAT